MTLDLSAVAASPNDLDLRRELARALDRTGDPRGRFIAVQLDASSERLRTGAAREYWSLAATADAMLERHGAEWKRDLTSLVHDARFHRGFVESVTVDARVFLARGAELYKLAPVRSVTLTDVEPVFGELLESELLRPLAHLGLQVAGLEDDGVCALAGCPRVADLRLLDVSFNGMTGAGLEAIAASKNLSRLVFVNIAGNPCGDPMEDYGIDPMLGTIVAIGSLPTLGVELEAKYGPLAWLHAARLMLTYPPTVEDV